MSTGLRVVTKNVRRDYTGAYVIIIPTDEKHENSYSSDNIIIALGKTREELEHDNDFTAFLIATFFYTIMRHHNGTFGKSSSS